MFHRNFAFPDPLHYGVQKVAFLGELWPQKNFNPGRLRSPSVQTFQRVGGGMAGTRAGNPQKYAIFLLSGTDHAWQVGPTHGQETNSCAERADRAGDRPRWQEGDIASAQEAYRTE